MGKILRWILDHGVATVITVAALFACLHFYQEARAADRINTILHNQIALDSSTIIRLTDDSRQTKNDLEGLKEAVKEMNGTLLAGVRVHFPERSGTRESAELPTSTAPDSARVATFHDSLKAGSDSTVVAIIDGTITAPPGNTALGIKYTWTIPPFDPEVGFVAVGNKTFAVVKYGGQEVRAESPYARNDINPEVSPKRFVTPFVEGLVEPGMILTARGGVELNLPFWGLSGVAEVSQRWEKGEPVRLQAGVKKTF